MTAKKAPKVKTEKTRVAGKSKFGWTKRKRFSPEIRAKRNTYWEYCDALMAVLPAAALAVKNDDQSSLSAVAHQIALLAEHLAVEISRVKSLRRQALGLNDDPFC